MKCERWINQHGMSMGQRKNLSPLQKLLLRIEAMTQQTQGMWTHGEQGHLTEFFFPLSHAHVMLTNSPLAFHYRAQNSLSLFTYHCSQWIWQYWSLQYAGRLPYMNSVKWPYSPWIHMPGVPEVMGSIPVEDSDFFSVTCSYHVD